MEPNFSLAGKVIVVTGGTGVLGGAFVEAIAAAGGVVGILGRNEKIANERANAINQKGGQALALIADVTNESQLESACQQMLAAFGKIDGLVNAAGGNMPDAVLQPDQDVFQLNFQALQDVMQLNLMGTVMSTQVFGNAIKNNGSGSIVNISSVSANQAVTRVLGYSLAKTSIDCFTKWMAKKVTERGCGNLCEH